MQEDINGVTYAPGLSWGSIIAGALAATGITIVLLGFGAAIGLSTASTSPSWRDASVALWILSGLYLILVSIASFGVGGYITGRLSGPAVAPVADEQLEFRDGAHGLAMWGLAVLLGAMMIALAAARPSEPVNQSASASTKGESLLAYELDRLFRTDRRANDADAETTRSEAARILLTSSSHEGVSADDKAYLTRMVAARTGIPPADAERRVTTAIDRSHESIVRARRSAVITAFMAAAALLAGAAIAWMCAREGALDRIGRLGSPMAALFRTHRHV